MIKSINSQYTFSLYNNLFSVEYAEREVDINHLFEIIRYGYLRKEVEAVRSAFGKEEYKSLKSGLPAFTSSRTFNYRSNKGLIKHSSLMQIDIDHVVEYDKLFNAICDDHYTYVAFRSPGGNGIKVRRRLFSSYPESLKDNFL